VPLTEPMPIFIAPMLLGSTTTVPDTSDWALEVKWDGMRAQAGVNGRRVTVRSRPGRDCTAQFPELQGLLNVLHKSAVLDGELVCFDAEGRPDFDRLRGRLRARTVGTVDRAQAAAPACLLIFDVLHFGGHGWRARPYRERRQLLDELALEDAAWRTPRAFTVDEDIVAATRAKGLEGVVAKRLDAPYQSGRRGDAWLKYKHRQRERLTITGWRPADRREPDEIFVARREPDGTLRYAGGVRFGLTNDKRRQLRAALQQLEESYRRRPRVRRVRPLLKVDVDYHGRAGGPLRDPVMRHVELVTDPDVA
jgi:bifunctional non-homologous end joining protein LigD